MSSITHIAVPQEKLARQAAQRKSNIRRYLPMYLAIAPFFVLFLIFGLIPICFSLYLALQKWDGIGKMQFVGLTNFGYALTDPIFGQAVLTTFEIWFISTIPMLVIALVLAFLINMRSRAKLLYEVCYYLPYVTSIVAIALIFGSLYSEQYGLINQTLMTLHLPAIHWMSGAWSMKWAVALLVIWRWTGYNALIYMAGLQSISKDFYEAARIDGAGTWDVFRSITVPLLRPIILFTVITSTIGGMTLFTEPQVLFGSDGGVAHAGLTMQLYMYWQTFPQDHYGYGAAVSWIMFIIVLLFSIVNWRIIMRGERS